MPAPKDVIWPLDPHTRAKHEILRRYLQAWLPIMTSWNGRVVVLDGFAGPGEYEGGEPGSPLIAIDTLLDHSHAPIQASEVVFLFIEKDHERAEHLRSLLKKRLRPPKAKWVVIEGEFDETVTGVLDEFDKQGERPAPTFAFLDPFGYSGTPLSTISRLMRHQQCEVMINFMYGFLNRFLTFENAANEAHYDHLFGTSSWREIVARPLPPHEREKLLHDLYQTQLQTSGGARYVRSFRMRNRKNNTEYYLFFGTNSLKGLDKMKQAMWKVDPSGAYDFSDLTDPDQPVLFAPEPDRNQLASLIAMHFASETVRIRDVQDFVIADTAFHSGQYKKVLKQMETGGHIVPDSPPPSRRAGTYGDLDMRIRFE